MTAEPLARLSVACVPLTETAPIANRAPSGAAIANRAAAGRFAAAASSASSNPIVSVVPAAATLAETGTGPRMSMVASATFDTGPALSELNAETR